ncbi:hypothetical protein [Streptomyces sp. NBC_01198]|uniref:hypothetical protein n=1 Tax=Streptomyces sp. NBC_01198 TaxID=2903769 RepID=UPI002E123D35|nr:hypothetical protein OG702_18765 [Streptomyces sp. NBC_01198]
MLLAPEQTLFVRGDTPLLLLAGAPVHDALPLVTAPGETLPACEGWSIVPRLTLCVVDGPGDHGVVIPAFTAPVVAAAGSPAADGMAEWCTDVEKAGGAIVLSLDRLPDVIDWSALLAPGAARGGFLPAVS